MNKDEMTLGDWYELGHPLSWSILERNGKEALGDDQLHLSILVPMSTGDKAEYEARKLNLRAPEGTPDGNHPVLTHGLSERRYSSHPLTAEVRNGNFIPEVTADAVLVAASAAEGVTPREVEEGNASLCHRFIEDFEWNPDTRELTVGLGS